MLAHSLEIVTKVKGNVDILLTGHTHGGQVCLPLIGLVYVPSRLGKKYVSGLYNAGGIIVYVNRGLGGVSCRSGLTAGLKSR